MSAGCSVCGALAPDGTSVCTVCGRPLDGATPRMASSSSLFVGRDREVELLMLQLDDAISGQGSLAMVTGEAGAGKTHFARQLAELARRRGAVVIWGCCFEGDWQPAYGPWVEALGSLIESQEPRNLRAVLGQQSASTLARLLPQMDSFVPDLVEVPPLGPGDERIRVYDAVIRLLHLVSQQSPVLLVIDDLHWADRDSLHLLRYLSRTISRSRILVVGVYREPEDALPAPLAEMLPIMRRETDFRQVVLHGFSLSDVGAYLAQATGRPLPSALVEAIYRESGGNPFYVRELLRHLTEEGKILLRGGRWSTDISIGELGIPDGVRELVDARLSRLQPMTAEILRLASCFGGGFEFSVLAALTGFAEEQLLDCIDEAMRSGLIKVGTGAVPSYDFSHDIVRHALYDELNPDRRARLHRRIALALGTVYQGREADRAGELALHFRASADLPGARDGLPHAVAASDQARAAYAYERAVTFLLIARDLAAGASLQERSDILCRLAASQAEALLLEDAGRSAKEALSALLEIGAGDRRVAEFLESVARPLKDGGAPAGVWRPLVEQGLSVLENGEQPADLLWARLTLLEDRLETISIGTMRVAKWMGHDPRAVEIARNSGFEEDYARTLEPLEWRSRAETEQLLALARGWSRPTAVIRALDVVGRDFLKRHGDHREAAKVYRELLETSERCGYIPGQAEALMQLAITETSLGEIVRAQQTARRAQEAIHRLGPDHELQFGTTALISVLTYVTDRGWVESTAAADRFVRSPEAARNPRGLVAGAYAALGHARLGDETRAKDLLAALTPVLERLEPQMYVHHAAIAMGASAVWELRASEYAACYRRLAEDLIRGGFGDSILSHELTIARMSTLLGDRVNSERNFAKARLHTEALGLSPIRALVDFDEGMTLAMRGDWSRGQALVEAALSAFKTLGMAGWAERAASLLEKMPRAEEPIVTSSVESPAGLTEREVEVLKLLAGGKSNVEIAELLVLSVRTVERHVANIYTKIGAHSRVGATNFAFSSGLATTPEGK